MATSSDQWSSDANEAVRLNLVQPGEGQIQIVQDFHPKFTYPIFGEEERIFGYKGLDINVRFSAHDLRPNVSIAYERRFPSVGDTVALDIDAALRNWLPDSAFTKAGDFERFIQNDVSAKDFGPPGRLIKSYTRKGKDFEIWAGSLMDLRVRDILDRMQIFISFFIEGGVPLNTGDADWTVERWTVYLVYEKASAPATASASPYSFIGYATAYRFYAYVSTKDREAVSTLLNFPVAEHFSVTALHSRAQISQFLVLPPYQNSGHGSALYTAIYGEALADPNVHELTVEDPNEEFDALRDINDWKVLEPRFRAASVCINVSPYPEKQRIRRLPTPRLLQLDVLQTIRQETKIAGRQFARQLEMFLLSLIPRTHRAAGGASLTKLMIQKHKTADPSDRSYYWWRLITKQRIYKKNKDILQQLDLEERRPKVEESLRALEDEYEKLLGLFVVRALSEGFTNGNGTAGPRETSIPNRKRRIVGDDDEEEEEAEEGDCGQNSGSKRAKT